ncbi:MAG: exodeoxyribonuclease VII small subunit [Bacilli bacterium]|nr:exodeoxyribonuclease VII small subunit [Bacilli bacterium]
MANEDKKPFEQRLERLNEIVNKIETETLSLNQSMALYEEGKKLIVELEKELSEAKIKIETIREGEK